MVRQDFVEERDVVESPMHDGDRPPEPNHLSVMDASNLDDVDQLP